MNHYAKTTEDLCKEIENLALELNKTKKEILDVVSTTNKPPIDENITFAEWWNIFIDRYSIGRVAEKTIERYQNSRLKLCPIENKSLCKITAEDIQAILEDILAEEKYRTAEVVQSNLNTCFCFAIEKAKILVDNPIPQTVVPHNYSKKTVNELSHLQKKVLLDFCYSNGTKRQQVYKDILGFYYDTGVRLSEAIHFNWKDWEGGDTIFLQGTKTEAAKRIIVIPPQIILMLKRRQQYRTSSPLVFPSSKNTPLQRKNVWRCCKRILETCPQAFRVSFASDAARSGAQPKALQRHLGHKKIETTLKHYVRVDIEDLRQMVKKTRSPFGNSEALFLSDSV